MVSPAGLAVSISQSSLTGGGGQEVPVSGKVTAFGLGVPALVQLRLTGPSEETFTTFSGPDGFFDVAIDPTTPGTYNVEAAAFPPLPGLGSFFPPIARSPGPQAPSLPPVPSDEAGLPRTPPQPPITIPVDIQIPQPPSQPQQPTFQAPSIFDVERPEAPDLELSPIVAFTPSPSGQPSGRIVGFVLGGTSGTGGEITGFTTTSTPTPQPTAPVVFLKDFDPAQYESIRQQYIAAGFTEQEATAAADRITVNI